MHALARFSIFAFAALFTTYTSKAPPLAPAKQVVFCPTTNFSPAVNDVLLRILGLVGTPYRWGGNTPDSGPDCSGLINFVYRDMTSIRLPRPTREVISMRTPSMPMQALQTGDLVFFVTSGGRIVSYADIYVGKGCFARAPCTGDTMRLGGLQNGCWQRTYLDARHVLVALLPLTRMP